jgi:hypothetical protein
LAVARRTPVAALLARLALVAALFGWLAAGRALAATVVIVRPANSSPAMAETVVRIHGELMSAGFGVEMVDESTLADVRRQSPRGALERLADQRKADAVIAIVGDVAPDTVEAWVVDRVTGKSVIRTLPFEPWSDRGPQTLAVRAIELLRSSFLEIHLAPSDPGSEPPVKASPTVVRFVGIEPSATRSERIGVEVGATALIGLDGVGTAFLPALQVDWVARPSFLVQISMAGLGSRPSVEGSLGSAQVAQEYGVVGACYRARPRERVSPFLSLSAGALHTSVEGRGNPPNPGLSDQQWSFLVDAGLGTWVRLRDRFQVAVAAHVQFAEPYLGVRFANTVVATSGRPNLLLTLTVGAWL